MTAMQKLSEQSRRLGVYYGESAASFRARNPVAASQLAAFIKANQAELVKGIAKCAS